ncbi:MAG: class I SAM-dependent methyltransferase [Candidatus Thorarchaeota archaeon]|nr:class I SAM-dependent methyltransferase [Candidatus Thorarchaeota archaeon]
MPKENKDIFSDLKPGYEGISEFYDYFADNIDLPFYLDYAKQTGSPILDIASGTGRVAISLAAEGFDVVGVESSPSMLRTARKKIASLPIQVSERLSIIEGQMENFDVQQTFKLIIIPHSFGHALTTESQLSTLRCIHKHLDDDGLFILDLYPAALEYDHARFEDPPACLEDGKTIERHGEIHTDLIRQLLRVDLRYIVRDSTQQILSTTEVISSAALIFNREADLLVKFSGFDIVQELGDYDSNPYKPDSNRRILILKKSLNK